MGYGHHTTRSPDTDYSSLKGIVSVSGLLVRVPIHAANTQLVLLNQTDEKVGSAGESVRVAATTTGWHHADMGEAVSLWAGYR